ncbi:membrane-bound PQQ-dependent dehydrogenase, glucose/quinate/shikimate family [Piscinibacter sakaiensis]|uniref:membrane-bound PQQ-dependent dehydrogenase, glucose/quinate/shikimate family n=1 Tax=Piscinibacter sakaiensis TaxID=1547922 RepID=UPI003AAAE22A
MSESQSITGRLISLALVLVCVASAAALTIGGVRLLTLGGSGVWYLLLSLGLLATAALLWLRRPAALSVYAVTAAATLVWAIAEAGVEWWPLAARLGLVIVIGVVLLLPVVRRSLRRRGHPPRRGDWYALAGVMAAFVAVAIAAGLREPHRIAGALPFANDRQSLRAPRSDPMPAGEWQAYGRTGFGQRYSPLAQITSANASRLELAWQFHTGDLRGQPGDPVETTFEVTPLKIGDRLFLCTPHQFVIALDAVTGRELWRFDPKITGELALQHLTCRGLGYQPPALPVDGAAASAAGVCASKLFMPTSDGRLIALDPDSGRRCAAFGRGSGEIDLWANMPNKRPGGYYSTSPPVVTRKLVIVGGTVLDNVSVHETSGVIRAFDVETGELVWNWDAADPQQTAPIAEGKTYTPNSPNSWSISSVDEELGMVYVPMGNQPPDQWGGRRSAAVERYSSSVVALDLQTGQVRWFFQTVHHDLWDYDVPSQPSLLDLTIRGQRVPALVQPTKQGEVFVLDRRNGEPLLPVAERPAPQGAAAGDFTAPTQPVSALSFDPPALSEQSMWGASIFDQLWCRIAFRKLRYEGRYTPPSTQGSLIYPGNFGVFNWGSIAVDPLRQIAFTTPNRLAFISRLVPRDDASSLVVNEEPPKGALPALNENFGAPFAVELKPFTSPLGIPCQAPPWGLVAGADLTSGRTVWQHPNGTVRDLAPLPLPFRMGVPNLGGPILTAGGVAFLSGTLDYYVRAYDVTSGNEVWKARLPAGGQATPMTYLGADGRQYLLVVAGGHGSIGTKAGDSVLAYALPSLR